MQARTRHQQNRRLMVILIAAIGALFLAALGLIVLR